MADGSLLTSVIFCGSVHNLIQQEDSGYQTLKSKKISQHLGFDIFISQCQCLRSQPNVPIRPTRRRRLTFSLFHGFRQFQKHAFRIPD